MPELGVETDDPDDIEVGAVVWSLTHYRGHAMRGGVVIGVTRLADDDETVMAVDVLEPWTGHGPPPTFTIQRDDLNMTDAKWFSRDARLVAEKLFAWLGSKQRPVDPRTRAWWAGRATQLSEAGLGSYLPGAETRYQRWRASRSEAS